MIEVTCHATRHAAFNCLRCTVFFTTRFVYLQEPRDGAALAARDQQESASELCLCRRLCWWVIMHCTLFQQAVRPLNPASPPIYRVSTNSVVPACLGGGHRPAHRKSSSSIFWRRRWCHPLSLRHIPATITWRRPCRTRPVTHVPHRITNAHTHMPKDQSYLVCTYPCQVCLSCTHAPMTSEEHEHI